MTNVIWARKGRLLVVGGRKCTNILPEVQNIIGPNCKLRSFTAGDNWFVVYRMTSQTTARLKQARKLRERWQGA